MKHARRIKARISVPILGRPRLRDRQQLGDKLGTRRAHSVEKDANEAATRNHRAGFLVCTRPSTDTRRDPRDAHRSDRARRRALFVIQKPMARRRSFGKPIPPVPVSGILDIPRR